MSLSHTSLQRRRDCRAALSNILTPTASSHSHWYKNQCPDTARAWRGTRLARYRQNGFLLGISGVDMNLKKLGMLGYCDTMSGAEGVAFARNVEKLGYSVLWVPETFDRYPFVMATHLAERDRGNGSRHGDRQRVEARSDGDRGGGTHVSRTLRRSLHPGTRRQRGPVYDSQRPQVCEAGDLHA